MIKSIRTKNLYGRFNYNFDLSKNKMTIISGPNGYGKTTLLKIIRDVLDDDIRHLASISFEELEIATTDGVILFFEKKDNKLFLNKNRIFIPLAITGNGRRDERTFFTINPNDIEDIKALYNRPYVTQQQLLTVTEVVSHKGKEIDGYSSEDLILRINAQIAEKTELDIVYDLLMFYKSVGNSIYSGADRLYRDYGFNDGHLGKKSLKEVILDLPTQLNLVFNYYDNEYTRLSNALDYLFMSTLSSEIKSNLSGEASKIYTKENYESDKKEIDGLRDKLLSYGILPKDELYRSRKIEFNKEYNLVFKIFNKNYKEKLAVLKELTDKLDLFTKIINEKMTNKKIIIDRSKLSDSIIIKDGDLTIPLNNLSSGEKEIILMYYKLIFGSGNKVIALVDEPELSSHVSWQYEVLDDFDKILEVNKNVTQIIVCTHSPQIVNDRWEQAIDLFEESNILNGNN